MNFLRKLNGQNILSILFFYLLFSSFSSTANNYSIYLVRHAETINDSKSSSLNLCGKFRAKQLASLLSQTNITQIYSTYEQHSMQTVRPLANKQNVAVKNYNPKYLKQLNLKLKQQQMNTLVVGDKSITQRLISKLTNKNIAPISEGDYQKLYQIQFFDEKMSLSVFQQPLSCQNN